MSENLEESAEDLAKVFSLDVSDIPESIKQHAKILLKVIDSACVDDPIVLVDWTTPWPRRGRGQTKTAIINHITTNNGTNEFNIGKIFSFRNSRQLGACMGSMPAWSLHDRVNPNVRDVGHCYRINKVADRSAELEDYNVIFNV
uniref:Putative serine/threonine-protein kinase FPV212 n=1 Tax=Anthurium amnicola TaxID=1678845 RepID=A0A1D1YUM0_9ARAE